MADERPQAGALYDVIGQTYSGQRRTDPKIAVRIWDALGEAETVLNVGAGTGSYEPPGRNVTAVEPSAVMRAQRPPGSAPCVDAALKRSRLPTTALTWRWPCFLTITGLTRSKGCANCSGSDGGPASFSGTTPEPATSGWFAITFRSSSPPPPRDPHSSNAPKRSMLT
jgi:hypothetical protein